MLIHVWPCCTEWDKRLTVKLKELPSSFPHLSLLPVTWMAKETSTKHLLLPHFLPKNHLCCGLGKKIESRYDNIAPKISPSHMITIYRTSLAFFNEKFNNFQMTEYDCSGKGSPAEADGRNIGLSLFQQNLSYFDVSF